MNGTENSSRSHRSARRPAAGRPARLDRDRERLDRLGERRPRHRDAAALNLLDAWATGPPGGCATVHATTACGALHRLDRLTQGANVPPQHALVAEAVGAVLLVEGGNAGRRVREVVREVVRVLGHDGTDYELELV